MTMTITTPVAAAFSALAVLTGAPAAASPDPSDPDVVAAEREAAKLGVTIVWADDFWACDHHDHETLGCFTTGQGAEITIAMGMLEDGYYSRDDILDVIRHEAAHYWIYETCGTTRPPILMTESGARVEYVTDAYAAKYFGMGLDLAEDFTDEDTAIATAIREERRCGDAPEEPQDLTPAVVDVHRFWSPAFDDAHFLTIDSAEADEIRRTDQNWTYEGIAFHAYVPQRAEACADGTAPVYRFYSESFGTHFFTIDGAETDGVRDHDENWAYEGVAFCELTTSAEDTAPVHRFWSPTFNKHFFTIDEGEMTQLRDQDDNWIYEGVAWYAPATQTDTTDIDPQ